MHVEFATEEGRKRAILDAAAQLIAERGYHAVRVADIAHAAGTSTGTVHYYFPGKADVLTLALRHGVNRAFDRQGVELRKIKSAHERLLRLIDMQLPRLGPVRDEWTIWTQYWAEAIIRPELRPMHNELYARWNDAVVRIVRRGQMQGEFRDDLDPEVVAIELTALTDGLGIHVLTGVPRATLGTMREVLVAYVENNLVKRSDPSSAASPLRSPTALAVVGDTAIGRGAR